MPVEKSATGKFHCTGVNCLVRPGGVSDRVQALADTGVTLTSPAISAQALQKPAASPRSSLIDCEGYRRQPDSEQGITPFFMGLDMDGRQRIWFYV